MKKYIEFINEHVSRRTLEYLELWGIKNFTINKDGSVDVNGDVDISHRNLIQIPIEFNVVHGNFNCSRNNLNTLKGCPKYIHGGFNCSNNLLWDFKYFPSSSLHNWKTIIYTNGMNISSVGILAIGRNPFDEILSLVSYSSDDSLLRGKELKVENTKKFISDLVEYTPIRGNKILSKRFKEALLDIGVEYDESTQEIILKVDDEFKRKKLDFKLYTIVE
jgi:hypothetical protein